MGIPPFLQRGHTPRPSFQLSGCQELLLSARQQERGPWRPQGTSSGGEVLVTQGRVRRAGGQREERNGGQGWEAMNAGPQRGLYAGVVGSHDSMGGRECWDKTCSGNGMATKKATTGMQEGGEGTHLRTGAEKTGKWPRVGYGEASVPPHSPTPSLIQAKPSERGAQTG